MPRTPSSLTRARSNELSASAAGVAAALAMVFIGVFGVLSPSTDQLARLLLGDFAQEYTSARSAPIGSDPDTSACAQAAHANNATCRLTIVGLGVGVTLTDGPQRPGLRSLEPTLEGAWNGTDLDRAGFELTSGRWPERPGEVVVGPDYEHTSHISAWGGRVEWTVVGTARRVDQRHGRFLLVPPGTFAALGREGMELSGVSAFAVIPSRTRGSAATRAGLSQLGVIPPATPGRVLTRASLGKTQYKLQGVLAMLLPALVLAGAGGTVAAALQGRWHARVRDSLGRQGVSRATTRRWLAGAQWRLLLPAVVVGSLVGYGASWLARPVLGWVLGTPQSSPVTQWFLLLVPIVVMITGMGLAGLFARVSVRRRAMPAAGAGTPRAGRHVGLVALIAVLLAIWVGPLVTLDATIEELLGGALLALAAGLATPWLLSQLSLLPLPAPRDRLALRVLRGTLTSLGARLGVFVTALSLMGVISASLASSIATFDQQIHSSSSAPRDTVSLTVVNPSVRATVPQWSQLAGLAPHEVWLATASDGRSMVLVADQPAAEVAIGRPLDAAEQRALAAGKVLTPDAHTQVQIPGPRRTTVAVPGHALVNYDPYLYDRAGLMLARAWVEQTGSKNLGESQYVLFGGHSGDVERSTRAAIKLGIGSTHYTGPSYSDRYQGTTFDRAQPWLLALLAALVMVSVAMTLARGLRPARAAVSALGLPRRTGLVMLAWQLGLVVAVVVGLSTLVPVASLMVAENNGQVISIPWALLVRSAAIMVAAGLVGALAGSWRVRTQERMSQ